MTIIDDFLLGHCNRDGAEIQYVPQERTLRRNADNGALGSAAVGLTIRAGNFIVF
jgi:hypothetical protein